MISMIFLHRQFQAAMLFKDSALLDRIFRVVDADDDDQICFIEYLSVLSTISNKASQEDKLRCKCFPPFPAAFTSFTSSDIPQSPSKSTILMATTLSQSQI